MDIINIPIDSVKPYKGNQKIHTNTQIQNVANSISKYGWQQPIVVDSNMQIIIGHCRYAAAKYLGLQQVPVLIAQDLTEQQTRQLRIADNKTNESQWDLKKLKLDSGLSFSGFNFSFSKMFQGTAKQAWTKTQKMCDLKLKIQSREKSGFIYTSFFATSKQGTPLQSIKTEQNIPLFASNLSDYITQTFGTVGDDWCICTTPPRRHKELHFSTQVCSQASRQLGIQFVQPFSAETRARVDPIIRMIEPPEKRNVFLYDDIITTGRTMQITRNLLVNSGHTVFCIVAIRNQ